MKTFPKLPAPYATFLLRFPISILFIQQGYDKLPIEKGSAEAYGLPLVVWFFVTFGELGSGIGLLTGGLLGIAYKVGRTSQVADIITRFSGITMTCIVTGVIWISMPDSLLEVLIDDYVHVSLYVGGLYFALRGNAKW